MAELNQVFRRYGLSVLAIVGLGAGSVACWIFSLPTWMLVLCLIFLAFAIIAFLGDLGLFGGAEPE